MKTKRVFVLKEEVGTLPRFFYYFDERYPRSLDPEAQAVAVSMGYASAESTLAQGEGCGGSCGCGKGSCA